MCRMYYYHSLVGCSNISELLIGQPTEVAFERRGGLYFISIPKFFINEYNEVCG